MNTKDLEVFLAIAETENMQLAAELCHKTPSVISKSLKRLETELKVSLFDRVGKHIRLNETGAKFQFHAANILAQTRQSLVDCVGLDTASSYRIAAPSILYFRWASVVTKTLKANNQEANIEFQTHYEQQALEQVKLGRADLAIITSAMAAQVTPQMAVTNLGKLHMKVAAGKSHPLITSKTGQGEQYISVSSDELLEHSFITPDTSPYCGENRGIGCDGWHNKRQPRKLTMVANDYAVLGQIVKSGQALAYLPDFWIRELGLVAIEVSDTPYQCQEEIILVSMQRHLVDLFCPS